MNTIWNRFLQHEFAYIVSIFISTLIIGSTYYHIVEGWRVLDALYFSVSALTTVGFGDFSPQTDAGKIFTMIYEILGIGIMVGLIDVVSHLTHNTSKKIDRREERRNKEEFTLKQ